MTGMLGLLAAAMAADRLIGDPHWLWTRAPHPVVVFGTLIGWFDRRLNDPGLPFAARRLRGVVATVCLVVLAGTAGAGLRMFFSAVPFGTVFELAIITTVLAQKSLIDHVRPVAEALARSLDDGRRAVALIVGRDTNPLDESGVSRAAIESAAENFSDGLVAPVFWYGLLGLPGLLVFKMVSTADSMIGHRSPRHEAFGWAAARLDDLLNLVPARVSALLLAAAAVISGGRAVAALRCAASDAALHRSPNAGWPEAAAAGALGLALGGPRRYGDLDVDGAWLNPAGRRDAQPSDIAAAIRLVDVAWALLLAAIILIALWTGR